MTLTSISESFLSASSPMKRLKIKDALVEGIQMLQTGQDAVDETNGETDVLSPTEISSQIGEFGDADWLRLDRAANYFAWRSGAKGCDLKQEAIVRALEGRRKCPRKVKLITFLCNVIRSIASEDETDIEHVEIDESLEFDKRDSGQLCDTVLSPYHAAQGNVDGERLFKEAMDLFDDDDTAKLLFEGMVEDIEGEELRALLELSVGDFDTKRRLVRRRLNKHFQGQKP